MYSRAVRTDCDVILGLFSALIAAFFMAPSFEARETHRYLKTGSVLSAPGAGVS